MNSISELKLQEISLEQKDPKPSNPKSIEKFLSEDYHYGQAKLSKCKPYILAYNLVSKNRQSMLIFHVISSEKKFILADYLSKHYS